MVGPPQTHLKDGSSRTVMGDSPNLNFTAPSICMLLRDRAGSEGMAYRKPALPGPEADLNRACCLRFPDCNRNCFLNLWIISERSAWALSITPKLVSIDHDVPCCKKLEWMSSQPCRAGLLLLLEKFLLLLLEKDSLLLVPFYPSFPGGFPPYPTLPRTLPYPTLTYPTPTYLTLPLTYPTSTLS